MNIKQGQYTLKTLAVVSSEGGKSVNLSGVFQEMHIFESIFTPTITGYIHVLEAFNYITGKVAGLPIMGNEIVLFEFDVPPVAYRTKDSEWTTTGIKTIVYYGRVTAIKNRKLFNDKSQSYEIHFAAEELVVSNHNRVSKSFKQKKLSEITKNIFDEFESKSSISLEETLGLYDIVIPNWSPLKVINWCAGRSLTKENNPNFFFYQTLYPTDYNDTGISPYYYKSLDNMLKQPIKKNIYFSPANQVLTGTNNNIIDCNAYNYQIATSFDTLDNAWNGLYNSNYIKHNLINKTWSRTPFDYESYFKSDIYHTEDNAYASPLFSGVRNLQLKTFNDYSESITFLKPDLDSLDSILPKKYSKLAALNNFKVNMIIPCDGRLTCGDKIFFALPSPEAGNHADEFLCGNYLVTAIRHEFTRVEYKLHLECAKESLPQNVAGYSK